jgi:hypothetical protein
MSTFNPPYASWYRRAPQYRLTTYSVYQTAIISALCCRQPKVIADLEAVALRLPLRLMRLLDDEQFFQAAS